MPVENPILGHFCEILPFSTGNKSVTKPIFQSNSITVVWLMYREKGFQWKVIGNEALLPSYYQLKTQFLPLWWFCALPLGCHWVAIGNPMATQWHLSGCKMARYTTKWVKRRGAIVFYKITYWIHYPIKSWRGFLLQMLEHHVLYIISYSNSN